MASESFHLETYKDLQAFVRETDITDQTTKLILNRISQFSDKQIRDFWVDTMLVEYLAKGLVDEQYKEIMVQEWQDYIQQVIENRFKLLQQGITENGDCYFYTFMKGDAPKSIQLTNFILRNIRKTVTNSNRNHILIADVVKADGSVSPNVILSGEDLSKPIEFRTTLRKKANAMLIMDIDPKIFGELVAYIDSLPYTPLVSIPHLGYHYEGGVPFFAYACEERNGYGTQKVVKTITPKDTDPRSDIYFEHIEKSEIKFAFEECDQDTWQRVAHTLLTHLPYVNNENQMRIMLAWFIASPLRHVLDIRDYGFRFPFLHVAGTPGAGKTTLLSILTGMMGYKYSAGSSFTTKFTIMKNMSENNALFFWIDEYKVDSKYKRESSMFLADLLRKGYDSGLEERGTKDQTNIAYKLISPVVISGESELTDAATLERTIQLILSAEEMDRKYKGNQHYKVISGLKGDIKYFARQFHQWLLDNHENWDSWILRAIDIVDGYSDYNLKERTKKKGISIALGLVILQKLAEEVGVDPLIYSNDEIAKVLNYLYDSSQISSRTESLEFHFLDFLADRWTDGLHSNTIDASISVRVESSKNEVIFRQSTWISYFRKFCIHSDLGPQQDNIIRRILTELERQGCIKVSNTPKSIGGKVSKCFVLDIKKVDEMYGIPIGMWKYDSNNVLDEDEEVEMNSLH